MKKEVKKIVKKVDKKNEEKVKTYEEELEEQAMEPSLESEYTKFFHNKPAIISLIIGLIIGVVIMSCMTPERIATLKDGEQAIVDINGESITADELYNKLNSSYGLNTLLDIIDNKILVKKYKEDATMISSVSETSDYWIDLYNKNYGLSEDEFLEQNGFADIDQFTEYLKLDYRKELYYNEYMKSIIKSSEIKDYYKESIFGDINTKYIAASTTDENKELLSEIIDKLNGGMTYDELKEEYSDNEEVTFKSLNYISYSDGIDEKYLQTLLKLENNTNSDELVQTNYGYTIIFRGEQKEKAKLEDAKEFIITKLIAKMENDDPYIKNKALIKMREEANVKFSDTSIEKKYNAFCENILSN